MSNGIIQSALTIFIVSIAIYVVKYLKFFSKYLDNKIVKIIGKIVLGVIMLIINFKIYKEIIQISTNLSYLNEVRKNNEIFEIYDEKILNELRYYKKICEDEYSIENSQKPYIPEGFEYVEGEWKNGFVIQDKELNQYVWVPCSNMNENDFVAKLERKNFVTQPMISKDVCVNDKYEKFLESALKNGGFYISRFEIGIDNNKPVSQYGRNIYCNITKNEAKEFVSKMYEQHEINCDLINGYAYDTTMSWLKQTNDSIKIDIYDIENNELFTGRNHYNNIYDFFDNIMEITSEESYSNIIIRGWIYEDMSKYENIINVMGISEDCFDRFSIREHDNDFSPYTLLTTRTILYK